MAYIGRRPDEVFRAQATHDTFTGDGSTVAFDLTFEAPDNDADLQVFVDNVRQEPGASKSYTIGADGSGDIKRVTFNVAPASSAEIYVINPGRDTSLIDVADAAVTTAKIASTAVTTAKIGADAITGAKLADDAVDSEHLVDGSVDNVHLSGSIANAKLANSSITINGTSVSLGGSVTAGVDWQAVTVADGSTQLSAVAGKGYFLDTNTGVIEVLLPASPSRGDEIVFADYGGNFATNNVIINTGGKNIDSTEGGPGTSNDFVIETNGAIVKLVYVDNNKGWLIYKNEVPTDISAASGGGEYQLQFIEATGGTVTTSGDYKIHTFTGDGCFVVSTLGNDSVPTTYRAKVDYLVVAGGGGGGDGGTGEAGGGGGAGGFRESDGKSGGCYTASPLKAACGALTITATTFPITVGAGGASGITGGDPVNAPNGTNGSNSVFSTITSAGGGYGAGGGAQAGLAGTGGSGGGGNGRCGPGTPGNSTGKAGNTPPVSPSQGSNGGNGQPSPGNRGGGGGGATAVGEPAADAGASTGGDGGAGATTNITGSPVAYAGGGGGGNQSGPSPIGGAGGTGGGGRGSKNANGVAGTANTGGGGGGSSCGQNCRVAGSGGKGVVVLRYKFK